MNDDENKLPDIISNHHDTETVTTLNVVTEALNGVLCIGIYNVN